MPDGFSQTGKSVNLSSSNTQQDWNGYGNKGKGNVKLDLEPFSYDNFINCRKDSVGYVECLCIGINHIVVANIFYNIQ